MFAEELTNLTVGQEVAVACSGTYQTNYSFGWKVAKITAAGQITLAKEGAENRRFTPRNREVGSSDSWRSSYIIADAAGVKARVAEKTRIHQAAQALQEVKCEVVARYASKATLQEKVAELEAALAKAKALVEAI